MTIPLEQFKEETKPEQDDKQLSVPLVDMTNPEIRQVFQPDVVNEQLNNAQVDKDQVKQFSTDIVNGLNKIVSAQSSEKSETIDIAQQRIATIFDGLSKDDQNAILKTVSDQLKVSKLDKDILLRMGNKDKELSIEARRVLSSGESTWDVIRSVPLLDKNDKPLANIAEDTERRIAASNKFIQEMSKLKMALENGNQNDINKVTESLREDFTKALAKEKDPNALNWQLRYKAAENREIFSRFIFDLVGVTGDPAKYTLLIYDKKQQGKPPIVIDDLKFDSK